MTCAVSSARRSERYGGIIFPRRTSGQVFSMNINIPSWDVRVVLQCWQTVCGHIQTPAPKISSHVGGQACPGIQGDGRKTHVNKKLIHVCACSEKLTAASPCASQSSVPVKGKNKHSVKQQTPDIQRSGLMTSSLRLSSGSVFTHSKFYYSFSTMTFTLMFLNWLFNHDNIYISVFNCNKVYFMVFDFDIF